MTVTDRPPAGPTLTHERFVHVGSILVTTGFAHVQSSHPEGSASQEIASPRVASEPLCVRQTSLVCLHCFVLPVSPQLNIAGGELDDELHEAIPHATKT